MQIQFQSFLFDSEDVLFAQVSGSVLSIVTAKGDLDVEFDSQAEADAAQAELGDLLDSAKAPSVTDLLNEAASVVSGLFGGAFGSVKAKASSASAKASSAKDSVESRVQSVIDELESALSAVVKGTTSTTTSTRTAATEAEDVFGTNRSTRAVTADVEISELTDAQLRSVISDKADELVATDARVQALVENIRRFHGDAEIQGAIEAHKDQIFAIARANDHLTVNAVFNELLRSL